MNQPQLTASRLELAATCSGAFAHEHVETTSEAAERGTQIHEYIAALLEEDECLLPPDEKTAALCQSLDTQELRDAASPNPYSTRYTEQGLYLSPTSSGSKNAGLLEADYHRDYSGAPEGALPGTADVVAVEEARVTVTDWKTGSREASDPAENYQLRFLGLAAARSFGKDEATVQIGAIRTDGSVELRSATLDAEDLRQIEEELARIARRVDEARAGAPVYRMGSHCRYCPALPHCPAVSGAAQSIMDGPPEELTPKRAAQIWEQLQGVEAAAKRAREALQEYVYARPIPTTEGRQLKVVETRRENIDSSKAFAILREYLPDDDIIAHAVSVTKTSLSGAVDKEAQREIIAVFKEAGAVNETYSESLREVRQ